MIMKKKLFTRFIGILVSKNMYSEIKAITDEQEISVTHFIRELIDRDLDSRERKEKGRKKQ